MARLITCDRCGRPIVGEPYVHRIDHRGGPKTVREQMICRRTELCRICAIKVAMTARKDTKHE